MRTILTRQHRGARAGDRDAGRITGAPRLRHPGPDDAADDAGVGRFGHGLGLQLTELFSNNATDETPLAPGFVMTLEPSALIDPAAGDELMIAHEEDIAITEHGAVWLSLRAPRQMDVILGDEAHDLEHADPLAELSIRCAELKRALEL